MSEPAPSVTRIGLLVPPSNAVMEVDFYRSLPEDITVHTTHINRGAETVGSDLPADNVVLAGKSLIQTEPALVVYGHTVSSYVDGGHGDVRLTKALEEATGLPVMTAASAVVRCLQSIGAHRVWFVAPFPRAVTETGAAFLNARGFEVAAIECMTIEEVRKLKTVPAETISEVAMRAVATADADALYICGTGLRTRALVGLLERELKKPVITANLAALWGALERLGHASRFSFGESRLLEWQRSR